MTLTIIIQGPVAITTAAMVGTAMEEWYFMLGDFFIYIVAYF
jgi:hypothetical protein